MLCFLFEVGFECLRKIVDGALVIFVEGPDDIIVNHLAVCELIHDKQNMQTEIDENIDISILSNVIRGKNHGVDVLEYFAECEYAPEF